jgi:autotransporter-associated beta strand protein
VYVLADDQDYTFAGTGFLSGGTALFKTGAGQLTLDTPNTATGGINIDEGIVQIGDGVSFNGGLAGNVTNNDTLIYATPGTLSSAVSISGSGSLTETGPGAVTITGTQTYTGPTTLGAGGLTIGGILPPSDITDNGVLGLSPSTSQVYGNNISGSGSVVTTISGALTLTSSNSFAGNLTNISGFLILSNNQAAGFGTVVCSNGPIVVASGIVINNNFSIASSTADLNMMATNSGTATWAGNVVNLGSGAQWRPGSDGGTLVFLGNALMGSRNFIVPRGAVQFGSNAVISATGTATALGRDGSAGNRSANVTLRDNAAVSFGVCSLGGGDQGGNVTLTMQNNASLACTGNFDVQDVNRAAAITFIRLNGGTMTVNGFTKTKTSETNSITFNGGILKAAAPNAAFLPQFNFTTNAVQAGGAIIDDSGFAITIAAGLTHDPSLGATPDGGLKKLGAGTLTFVTPQNYTGPTTISNGTLALTAAASSGSIASSPGISIASGAAFDVSGVSGISLANNQTLTGSGTVKGALIAGNGSTIAPGPGLTALTFNNSLTLAAGSTTALQLSHSPLANDSLAVAGTLNLGGTLTLTNSGGTAFAAGDAFQLFTAGSFGGTFATVNLPALPVGLAWNTNALNTAGTVSVILTTSPVFGTISVSGNSLGLSGTGGVGNAHYILLGSTNLSGGWTPLFTNQFDASGNFNFTTNASTSSAQNFYRLQLQ